MPKSLMTCSRLKHPKIVGHDTVVDLFDDAIGVRVPVWICRLPRPVRGVRSFTDPTVRPLPIMLEQTKTFRESVPRDPERGSTVRNVARQVFGLGTR